MIFTKIAGSRLLRVTKHEIWNCSRRNLACVKKSSTVLDIVMQAKCVLDKSYISMCVHVCFRRNNLIPTFNLLKDIKHSSIQLL
jgi:hypothetical protein